MYAKDTKTKFDLEVTKASDDINPAKTGAAKTVVTKVSVLDAEGTKGKPYIDAAKALVVALGDSVDAFKAWMDLDGSAGAYVDTGYAAALI